MISHTVADALYIMQILSSAFLAVLFLQSGIEKVIDRRGNLEWLKGHFAKSPVAGMVPMMVALITAFELGAGALSGIGCILIVLNHGSACAFYGAVLAALSILALFLGQRLAKDYAGAAVLVPYFLLTLVAIYILSS